MVLFPETRFEAFLAKIAGQDGPDLEPITRTEAFLDDIADGENNLEPRTRLEYWLQKIAENAGGNEHEIEDALITRTLTGDYSNPRVTKIGPYGMSHIGITSASFPNVTEFGDDAFDHAYFMTSLSAPRLTRIGASALTETKITNVSFPAVTFVGDRAFTACKNTVTLSLPSLTSTGSTSPFNDMFILETADLGQLGNLVANCLYGAHILQALILRKTDSICTLANVSALANTPLRGYGGSYSGHVYVPSALLETYKTAANWSTLVSSYADIFAPIEGSPYA